MSSLEDLTTQVKELTAQVENKIEENKVKDSTHKTAMDDMKKDHKDAMEKKDDEHNSQIVHKDDEHKEAYKSMYESMYKAMEMEKDDTKKEGMKATLKAMDEMHKKESMKADKELPPKYEHTSEEEKQKDREHRAEITYLTGQVNKLKINELTALYQASKTSEEDIKSYSAEWEKQTSEQLDAEIKKMMKIIGSVPQQLDAERSPFGFSTQNSIKRNKQFDAAKLTDKVDKLSDSELFNSPPGAH